MRTEVEVAAFARENAGRWFKNTKYGHNVRLVAYKQWCGAWGLVFDEGPNRTKPRDVSEHGGTNVVPDARTGAFYSPYEFDTLLVPVEPIVDKSRYPHACPRCRKPAYVGAFLVDCSAGCAP